MTAIIKVNSRQAIEPYMQKMLHEQTANERRKNQQKLWRRNPLTGVTVQAEATQVEQDRTARQLRINMGDIFAPYKGI